MAEREGLGDRKWGQSRSRSQSRPGLIGRGLPILSNLELGVVDAFGFDFVL